MMNFKLIKSQILLSGVSIDQWYNLLNTSVRNNRYCLSLNNL